MMEDESYCPSKTFDGVRFALFGFDALTEHKVRSKLVDGGGVDAGGYTRNCTHVIVDKLVFDDPVCVAAREDGKVLVTALWVDHSFDIGVVVEPTSIIYRPPKDLNGIPGAKNLIMCLTGYQRQDRDDIMTMVGLMGAQFSKPLVANKVTHLICYKFEGEKYELAKKMKRIKLVNHRWLEDCLRDWEILPEANYNKSGYELEMMEAEAKDSEDEAEGSAMKQSGGQILSRSPHGTKVENTRPSELSNIPVDTVVSKEKPKAVGTSPIQETRSNLMFNDNVPERVGHHDVGTLGGATSDDLANRYNKIPVSIKSGTDLASTSRTVGKSPSADAKCSALSYSRKNQRRASLLVQSEGWLDDGHTTSVVHEDDYHVDDNLQTSERATGARVTDSVVTPGKADLLLSNSSKRKGSDGFDSFKSQKISPNAKLCMVGSPIAISKMQRSESLDYLAKTHSHSPLGKGDLVMDETTNVHTTSGSTSRPLISSEKVTPRDLPSCQTAILDAAEVDSTKEVIPRTPSHMLGQQTMDKNGDTEETIKEKTVHVNDLTDLAINQPQNVDIVNSGEKAENEKPRSTTEQDLSKETGKISSGKSLKKKTVGTKTLGSRPKANSTTNRKGPIYINQMASRNDASVGLKEENRGADKISSPNNDGRSSLVVDVVNQDEMTNDKFGIQIAKQCESVNDETEAPEDREVDWGQNAQDDGKAVDNDASCNVKSTCEADTIYGFNFQEGEHDPKVVVHVNTSRLSEGDFKEEVGKGKTKAKAGKRKKSASSKTNMKTTPSAVEINKSGQDIDAREVQREIDGKNMVVDKEERVPHPRCKTNLSSKSVKRLKSSVDLEKENRLAVQVGNSISHDSRNAENTAADVSEISLKVATEKQFLMHQKDEPVRFIFSGHRLQRKEYQQVIKRLKGKVCRDSHQWSYQATHFIAPDPIRRTEKFFAATASGRWILKTDYLTACSQAGKLLAEEPYEWHKNCLTEDGAINLEAPRKWRLIREKTGHGAFYGMRIIVYGDCIAPPLDTLKRVVKAGDGTILATSPPYTRFLNSGVDYAIVSPGMPRIDMWVQEFLKHEIPCVVADYLVEYVCKPGYPLEKHVLYNTHVWAGKSFANLQNGEKQIAEDMKLPEEIENNDLACEVCKSSDRGEVMLICGDETGSCGCGVGTHIDCCDPPLENVPDENWFCSKCTRSSIGKKSKKRRK